MAFVSVETFESYTVGSDINGQSGGSGWSGAWSRSRGTATTETKPAGGAGSGTQALRLTGTASTQCQRGFTAITVGTIGYRVYMSLNNPTNQVLNNTDGNMYIQWDNSGNIKIYNNDTASYETIQAYSANTWYKVEIDFDSGAQPNKYRARIDGGTWTAWKTVAGGSYTNVSVFAHSFDNQSSSLSFWVDDIGLTETGGGAVNTPTNLALTGVGM